MERTNYGICLLLQLYISSAMWISAFTWDHMFIFVHPHNMTTTWHQSETKHSVNIQQFWSHWIELKGNSNLIFKRRLWFSFFGILHLYSLHYFVYQETRWFIVERDRYAIYKGNITHSLWQQEVVWYLCSRLKSFRGIYLFRGLVNYLLYYFQHSVQLKSLILFRQM